jgi:thiol-disulfide isomerase/thioredoxin
MVHRKIFVVIIIFVVLFLNIEITSAQIKKMPSFKLKNLQGKQISSSNFEDKVLLINFWATWCGPCKEEIPALIKLHKEYKEKGFQVISIAVSSNPKDLKDFAEKMSINYPILLGDAKVVRAFGNISVVPTTFIVDKKGNVQKMLLGAKPYKEFENLIRPFLSD